MSGQPISTCQTSTNLNSKDIAQILKACRENGVVSLELGSLKVQFGDQGTYILDKPLTTVKQNLNNNTKTVPVDALDQEVAAQQTEEERLELLQLTDPAAFEDVVEATRE